MFDAMSPTDFPRRFIRCRTIWLLRGLGFTLVVAIGWLAAPAISRAEVIDYVFSNASAVFNGTPESITGLVSIESINPLPEEWFAEIQLTGPAPYAGLYSAGLTGNFSQPLPGFDLVRADGLQIRFANNLSSIRQPPCRRRIRGGRHRCHWHRPDRRRRTRRGPNTIHLFERLDHSLQRCAGIDHRVFHLRSFDRYRVWR